MQKCNNRLGKKVKGVHEQKPQTTYPGFISMKHAKKDEMLVHRKVTAQQYVAGTHLYTWLKRDNVELSSLSKETTRRAKPSRSGVQGINRSATHAFS